MSAFAPAPFVLIVDTLLTQNQRNISDAVRTLHDSLLLSAIGEPEPDNLVHGIYRMHHYLPEGGSLHQWLALLNRTINKTKSPLSAVKRELCFGWFLALNNLTDLAAYAYERAASALAGLVPVPDNQGRLPLVRQAEMDLAIGRLFIRADCRPSRDDVHHAVDVWQQISRYGSSEHEKRLLLALAALKYEAGMIPAGYSNADDAFRYFDARAMNAEAGMGAFYLARYHAADEGIDPRVTPATGETLRWLLEAYERWNAIALPVGFRLLAPYIRHLDLVSPQPRPSRRNRHLDPPAYLLN